MPAGSLPAESSRRTVRLETESNRARSSAEISEEAASAGLTGAGIVPTKQKDHVRTKRVRPWSLLPCDHFTDRYRVVVAPESNLTDGTKVEVR